jgi:uridine phosphorylase
MTYYRCSNKRKEAANLRYTVIACSPESIGEVAIITGDPNRVPYLASYLSDSTKVAENREFRTYAGYVGRKRVSITSTGIGGASAAIVIEELISLRTKAIIRLGTAGALKKGIKVGDIVLATGAIRDDEVSRRYIPTIFPAVSDFHLLVNLVRSARKLKCLVHLGIVWTNSSFYTEKKYFRRIWHKSPAIAADMETATLFVISSLQNIPAASILSIDGSIEGDNIAEDENKVVDNAISRSMEIIVEAIKGM